MSEWGIRWAGFRARGQHGQAYGARGRRPRDPASTKTATGCALWSPRGGRKWVLRVTVDGKRREMGLGTYPPYRSRSPGQGRRCPPPAAQGQDPIAARRVPSTRPAPTFTEAAARYIAAHHRAGTTPSTPAQWATTLTTYAEPVLGSPPVDRIGTEDVLRGCSPRSGPRRHRPPSGCRGA